MPASKELKGRTAIIKAEVRMFSAQQVQDQWVEEGEDRACNLAKFRNLSKHVLINDFDIFTENLDNTIFSEF